MKNSRMQIKTGLICIVALSIILSGYSRCNTKNRRFTEHDILAQLDSSFNDIHKEYTYSDFIKGETKPSTVTYSFFLDLEHGYCLTASSKIHLYADSTRWAIVFEKSGYQNRGSDAEIELDYFGNCTRPKIEQYGGITYFSNSKRIALISGDEYERIRNRVGTDMETFEYISPDAEYVMVRDRKIRIEHDSTKYLKTGIRFDAKENPRHLVGFGDIVRYLNDTDPAAISATEKEIKELIPADLPKLMTIDKFHFESIYDKHNLPSKNETYQLLTKILVIRDTSLWKPKQKANNHWSNWESGNL